MRYVFLHAVGEYSRLCNIFRHGPDVLVFSFLNNRLVHDFSGFCRGTVFTSYFGRRSSRFQARLESVVRDFDQVSSSRAFRIRTQLPAHPSGPGVSNCEKSVSPRKRHFLEDPLRAYTIVVYHFNLKFPASNPC